jgi:hypothetical protein
MMSGWRVQGMGERATIWSGRMTHCGCVTLVWCELLGWSLIARLLVTRLSLKRTLRILDALPKSPPSNTGIALFPSDRQVRFAGACLGRSLARSQFLRVRGIRHHLVIGTTGGVANFRAHAWIAPFETAPEDFVEFLKVDR